MSPQLDQTIAGCRDETRPRFLEVLTRPHGSGA